MGKTPVTARLLKRNGFCSGNRCPLFPNRAQGTHDLARNFALLEKFQGRTALPQKMFREPRLFPELIAVAQGTGGSNLYRTPLAVLAVTSLVTCAHAESGLASYYGGRGHAGEMTCAHRTRPLGSMVVVSYRDRSIRCRINDRGPFIKGRVIDVSTSAARALGMMGAGVVLVSVQGN